MLGVGTTSAAGQSAEAWTQFQGDGAHVGFASDAVAPPYRPAWRFDPGLAGRFGVSPPVVAGDLAVTVGPRAVYGVELTTGEAAWEIPRAYGPSVAPAIATGGSGDVLIYSEGYGARPPRQAYASGTPTPSASAPAAPSPSTGTSDASDDGEAATDTRVVAVDLATRKPLWDAAVELPAVSRTGVTIDGDTAYVGDDDGIVTAIEVSTGDVRWTFDAPGPVSTAIAAAGGSVVLSTQPEQDEPAVVIALAAADGSESWRFGETSGPFVASIPVISGDTVYLGFLDAAGSRLRALALEDGAERWARAVTSQLSYLTVPIVTSDAVYAIDVSGQVHAVSPSSGEELWDYAINAFVPRAVPALASGTLLVPTSRGSLLAIDTESHDLVARTAATGPQGHLGALAVTPTVIVAVKGGHRPGLVAFDHDDGTALVSQPSPTVLDPGTMIANFAVAALPVLLLLALAGRWLRRRIGPAFADEEEPGGVVDAGIDP